MTHTLAAVFETRADATRASEALLRNGFDAGAIQIHDSGSVAGTARIDDDASILGNVKQMFSELFGRDHADQHVYAEALNRGHTVLSLAAGTLAEAERAADLIDDFHPLDIDEHEAMWRAGGWGADVLHAGAGPLQTSLGAQQLAAPEQHGIRPREEAVVFVRSEQVVLAPGALQRGDVAADTPPPAAEVVADIQNTVQRSGMRIYPRDAGINQDSMDILTGAPRPEDDYFRSHWESTYTGGTYQEYDPAYRYGESMRGNPGYRDKEWNDVEPELRASWESKQPQSSWDKFKDAVRHGWERITG